MSRPPLPLSRTSSSTSFSSEDDGASMSSSTVTASSSRRTRKRFTNAQLTMLENLFHQNSHPSRDDREAVAKAGGMEIKSVTIWFQNKRQTERKSAATSNTNNAHSNSSSNGVPNITSTMHTFSLNGTSRTASPSFSTTSKSSSRPSLDCVASRSELRVAAPRTPSRRHNPSGAIWENMPSSPLGPTLSPPPREFIDFGKNARTRRTLEWACAAARVAEKDGHSSEMNSTSSSTSPSTLEAGSNSSGRTIHREHDSGSIRPKREGGEGEAMDVDLTDEEDHEAITPPSTWGKGDLRWTPSEGGAASNLPKGVDDDDMFKAALALCGLGRRT